MRHMYCLHSADIWLGRWYPQTLEKKPKMSCRETDTSIAFKPWDIFPTRRCSGAMFSSVHFSRIGSLFTSVFKTKNALDQASWST